MLRQEDPLRRVFFFCGSTLPVEPPATAPARSGQPSDASAPVILVVLNDESVAPCLF